MRVRVTQVAGQRFEVRAGDASFTVDLPVEQGGRPGSFRSGELLLGALGACMLGTLVEAAAFRGTTVDGVSATLVAETAARPQRISSIDVQLVLPDGLVEQERDRLVRSASRCKIHNTLQEAPAITLNASTTAPTEASAAGTSS